MSFWAGVALFVVVAIGSLSCSVYVETKRDNKFWEDCHARGGYVFKPRGGEICLDRKFVIPTN